MRGGVGVAVGFPEKKRQNFCITRKFALSFQEASKFGSLGGKHAVGHGAQRHGGGPRVRRRWRELEPSSASFFRLRDVFVRAGCQAAERSDVVEPELAGGAVAHGTHPRIGAPSQLTHGARCPLAGDGAEEDIRHAQLGADGSPRPPRPVRPGVGVADGVPDDVRR